MPVPRVALRAAPFVIITVALVLAVVPTPAAWVERIYSRHLYLIVQNGVTWASSLGRFAFFDVLLVAALTGLVTWWVRVIRRADHAPGGHRRAVGRLALNTAAVVAAVYLLFLGIWGLNYRRAPLATKLDYDPDRITPRTVSTLAEESIDHLNQLFGRVRTDDWPELLELPDRLAPPFERVQRQLGASRTAVGGRPKTSVLTAYFRRAGIDGMINPFSLEVLINETVLPYERPFVVAHEWSHLAGYANEAEASFVGWLTCLAGDDQSRYSAWLFLTPHLIRNVAEADRAVLWARLDDGPRQHLQAIAVRLNRAIPVVRRTANRVYDRFLRVNRVGDGIASYGLVVDLVLGTDETPLWRALVTGGGAGSRTIR